MGFGSFVYKGRTMVPVSGLLMGIERDPTGEWVPYLRLDGGVPIKYRFNLECNKYPICEIENDRVRKQVIQRGVSEEQFDRIAQDALKQIEVVFGYLRREFEVPYATPEGENPIPREARGVNSNVKSAVEVEKENKMLKEKVKSLTAWLEKAGLNHDYRKKYNNLQLTLVEIYEVLEGFVSRLSDEEDLQLRKFADPVDLCFGDIKHKNGWMKDTIKFLVREYEKLKKKEGK